MPVKQKTYVLCEHTDSTAPIYKRVNKNQRVRLQKRPNDSAYLQVTCTEAAADGGKNRTLRLKLNSNTIYQDEQIKEGILANVSFTPQERAAVEFKYGSLKTSNAVVQLFLDKHPQNEKFAGLCDQIKRPLFREYNQEVVDDESIDDFDRRVDAANKIRSIKTLQEAQDMMYRLNGFYFKAPDTLKACKVGLIKFLDDAEDSGIDKIMQETLTADEEVRILVGKAIAMEVISFKAELNQVSVKKGTGWVNVRMISSDSPEEERMRLFVEFLGMAEGKSLTTDIRNKLAEAEKKAAKQKETV